MKKDSLDLLRELAKSDYYQSLYSSCKELGLQLFKNNTDLTRLQLWFISYMATYSVINTDIAMGEISEKVLDNFIYEDAYLLYKKRSSNKDLNKKSSQIKNKSNEKQEVSSSKWVFRKKK